MNILEFFDPCQQVQVVVVTEVHVVTGHVPWIERVIPNDGQRLFW